MTRDKMRFLLRDIIEDIEPWSLDDSDLHIPEEEIEKAVERILKLWEFGHTWEIKNG